MPSLSCTLLAFLLLLASSSSSSSPPPSDEALIAEAFGGPPPSPSLPPSSPEGGDGDIEAYGTAGDGHNDGHNVIQAPRQTSTDSHYLAGFTKNVDGTMDRVTVSLPDGGEMKVEWRRRVREAERLGEEGRVREAVEV